MEQNVVLLFGPCSGALASSKLAANGRRSYMGKIGAVWEVGIGTKLEIVFRTGKGGELGI